MNQQTLTRWDALKLAALLLMFIDHAGYFFYGDEQWIRGIGRACAPIFLFLAGFAPHYRFDRKLALLAALLTASDWLVAAGPNTLNILWTIIVVRMILSWLEHRGNYALRLHEWVIGALAMLPLVLVFQYGPLALLFALSGYVFKHHTHYAPKTPQYFMLVVIGLYGIAVALLSQFTLLTSAIMGASLIMMALLMGWFVRAPKATLPCPAPLAAFLRACSRHTAIIYVAHLMVLGWWMGKAI